MKEKLTKYSVTIAEPCTQKWSEMQPIDRDRFCQNCQHRIIDLTKMTDAQIVDALVDKQQGRVCGRLSTFQMHRNLLQPKIEKTSLWQRTLVLFGFIFSFWTSRAQEQKPVFSQDEHIELSDSIRFENQLVCLDSAAQIQNSISIKGQVIDHETKEPMPFAIIQVIGTNQYTRTDWDGFFEFQIQRDPQDTTSILLCVKYIAYFLSVIEVESSTDSLLIEMKTDESFNLQEVGMIIIHKEYDFGTKIRFNRFGRRED